MAFEMLDSPIVPNVTHVGLATGYLALVLDMPVSTVREKTLSSKGLIQSIASVLVSMKVKLSF